MSAEFVTANPQNLSKWQKLVLAMTSWRTASVSLLSFSSGLPLGLVWIAIPDWMASIGVDIRIVGLLTLAQVPWTLKILWSPLMDRYVPPFWGRRRGWILLTQILLFVLGLFLAGLGNHPETPLVVGAFALAIAFASASQDIVIDAYAVEVLRKDEQGIAVGARIAIYRAAMYLAGGLAISIAGRTSWVFVNILLAVLYIPMMIVTRRAPEPEGKIASPKTIREAVWEPFLGCLSRYRALEILAFVVFYKLADNMGQALLRPFLYDMGYSSDDRGFAVGTIGLVCTIAGTFLGGALTTVIGIGHSLWIFGFVQIFSNIGYILVASSDVNRVLMFGALGFETLTQGMGAGAFAVLLLRITQKQFSATQYALFSSLFGVTRVISGPVSGFLIHALGWKTFFWVTMAAGIPGLVLLQRFSPIGVREPSLDVPERDESPSADVTRSSLLVRGILGGVIGWIAVAFFAILLGAMGSVRKKGMEGFDFFGAAASFFQPDSVGGWMAIVGVSLTALIIGFFAAAVQASKGQTRG